MSYRLFIAAKEDLIFGPYGPSWYQELSERQMAAVDALNVALDHDAGQGTTFRTNECVRGLGLSPLRKSSELSGIIELCQANDIAFLWYLMEMYYANAPVAECKRGCNPS